MWAIFIKVLYDSSLLVKVIIWALVVYLIGYVLYEMFGWAGVAIPLLAIVSFVVYELTPSKEQRLYNKLKKERVSINNEILLSHPQATVIDCYRFDDNLPRVYELITENCKSERDDMFDIFFQRFFHYHHLYVLNDFGIYHRYPFVLVLNYQTCHYRQPRNLDISFAQLFF